MPTKGFGTIGVADIIINGVGLHALEVDVMGALNNVLVEHSALGAGTVTLIITDPFRKVLNSGVINQGDTLTLDGLNYTYMQLDKASDQLQMMFESTPVYKLRQQKGVIATTSSTTITGFVKQLVAEVPGLKFTGAPTQTFYAIAVGRGSSSTPTEDSWTCMQRLANDAGWRCWEYDGTVYFGPDTYWMKRPVVAHFKEFTNTVVEMDVTWDYGLPFGNLTATAFTGLMTYIPGSVIMVDTLGPASGPWLVNDMQRGLYSPMATVTLMAPLNVTQIKEAEAMNSGGNAANNLSKLTTTLSPKNGYPKLSVSIAPNPVPRNASFTVTCTIGTTGIGKAPTGTIFFSRNTKPMEHGKVKITGSQVSLTVSNGLNRAGPNQVICSYLPDAKSNWQQVTSTAALLTVTP